MNLRISFFIFAVSLIGHTNSAVIDLQPAAALLVNKATGEVSELKPLEQLILPKVVIEKVEVPSVVLDASLNSDIPSEVVEIVEETVPGGIQIHTAPLPLDIVDAAVGTVVDTVKSVAAENEKLKVSPVILVSAETRNIRATPELRNDIVSLTGRVEPSFTAEIENIRATPSLRNDIVSLTVREEPAVLKIDNLPKPVDITADRPDDRIAVSVVAEKSTLEGESTPEAAENLVPLVEGIASIAPEAVTVVKVAAPVAEGTVSAAPGTKIVAVENSAPVAEDAVVSKTDEGISAPVSAPLAEKASSDAVTELEKVKEIATPLVSEIKDPLITVSAPVYPSVSESSPIDVVSGVASKLSPSSIEAERFRYKAHKEKRTLTPVEASKNIYRTDEGDLVRLEIIERSAAMREENPFWVKVAPLPYPPRSIMAGDAPKVSHTNIKYTSVPGSTPVEAPTSVRVSRKLYSRLRTNPRARFGMTPALDQEYMSPAAVPELDCIPDGKGRCFFSSYPQCVYDEWGYVIYCW